MVDEARPDDITALPLLSVDLRPVVASGHPLAILGRRATSADLKPYVQLVLSDPVSPDGPSYGVMGSHQWRFVDLARRLDFLLSGFGWCKMPPYIVDAHLKAGKLVKLEVHNESIAPKNRLPVYAAHAQSRPLGLGGMWLLNDLRQRLANA